MSTEESGAAEDRPHIQRKRFKPGVPFDTCPGCGYERGFHLVPARARRASAAAQVSLLLKCPNCAAVYDVGISAAP